MEEEKFIQQSRWDNSVRNCFVYLHYTKDTNQLFYVGIGTHQLSSPNVKYNRAYQCSKSARNFIWRRIYLKHGRIVKIYQDNLTEYEAKSLEINLIKEYGRIITKNGVLANISAGGEGRFKDNSNNKRVYVYSLFGKYLKTYASAKKAAQELNLCSINLSAAARGERVTCGGYQFRYDYNKNINIKNLKQTTRRLPKAIVCTNLQTGENLEFNSMYKFAKYLGIKGDAHIIDVLNNKRKSVCGWYVRYK